LAGLAVTTAVIIASSVLLPASAQAGGPQPRIRPVHVERAPVGEKGGIFMPWVDCTGLRVEPRVSVRLVHRETGKQRAYSWTGSFPHAFPRVPVGHYRVVTEARCAGNAARKVEAVVVVEKTDETTMSRSEFDAITNGMTKAEVRQIVGYGGQRAGSYSDKVVRSYDDMAYWSYSLVEYRDGQVVGKNWDVAHD
jgi:hypothetical protein